MTAKGPRYFLVLSLGLRYTGPMPLHGNGPYSEAVNSGKISKESGTSQG
jgi:hypothetical protein